jgi:acetate kinase
VTVLILNAGSSTLKWTLLDARDGATLRSGKETWASADRRDQQLANVLRALPRFDAVGHRVVHGGTQFHGSTVITPAVRAQLDDLAALDPLHMRIALAGIDAVSAAFPSLPQVAAFDTAVHTTMPAPAAGYGLPYQWSERWQLKRFGFHGLSVQWSLERTRSLCGGMPARTIVCHLGGGCSITAALDGASLDTTMGFSPLEGPMMATRSGSLDPGLVLHLLTSRGVSSEELADVLANRSGLLGVSGISGDLREVLAAAQAGAPRAQLAYQRFVWTLRRALGAMAGVLGGADAIVFTGGIGENQPEVRREVAAALAFAGLRLDEAESESINDRVISTSDSRITALLVHAREDLVILSEVLRLTPSDRHSAQQQL